MQQPVGGGRKKRVGERGEIGGKEEEGREGKGERQGEREKRGGESGKGEEEEKERDRERGRDREREKRNVVHSTNRGVCLRATDLTIFWLVSGVASGRKASDGLTRVEQIYRKNKHKKKKKLTQTTIILQLTNICVPTQKGKSRCGTQWNYTRYTGLPQNLKTRLML